MNFKKNKKLIYQILALSFYSALARYWFLMERETYWVFLILLWTYFWDRIIGKFYFKEQFLRFSPAPIIISLGTSILIDSPYLWIYLFAGLIGLFCKGFIRLQNRHIFNPSGIGLVSSLLLFPNLCTGTGFIFGGDIGISIFFLSLGLFVSRKSEKLLVSISFLIFFMFFSIIRSSFTLKSFELSFIHIFSPGILLFTFHMITDPMTSPSSRKDILAYTFLISLIDHFFRQMGNLNGPYFGLVIVNAIFFPLKQFYLNRGFKQKYSDV